jgi:hypothetical protein
VGELKLSPIPLKTLPTPLIRLLPAICTYARLTVAEREGSASKLGPQVVKLYRAHVRVLELMLRAAADSAGLEPVAIQPLLQLGYRLGDLRGQQLADAYSDFLAKWKALYEIHHDRLRKAMSENSELYRELYWREVGRRNLLVIYSDETWAAAEKMGRKLSERCWYSCVQCRESEGAVWPAEVDVVLLVPGTRPIQASIERALERAEKPVLVLAGLADTKAAKGELDNNLEHNMAVLRTEFRYKTCQYNVLHGPFAPVRLYQAIDKLYLQNLAQKHAGRMSMEAVAS